jgi:acetyltransferase-like isoleucine patch superfamily enzyme
MKLDRLVRSIRRLSIQSPLDLSDDLKRIYYFAKTQLLYRPFFLSMGDRCIIRRPLLLKNCRYVSLGNGVSIRDGIRMEVVVSRPSRIPKLSIGNNVLIEQNVHIVCHSRMTIGNDVSIAGHCAIVDVTHPYEGDYVDVNIGSRILDQDSFVEIGDGAFLGYGCIVLPNVRIGRRAVIGANAVVTKDVPDYGVAAGNPARLIKTYVPQSGRWETPNSRDD